MCDNFSQQVPLFSPAHRGGPPSRRTRTLPHMDVRARTQTHGPFVHPLLCIQMAKELCSSRPLRGFSKPDCGDRVLQRALSTRALFKHPQQASSSYVYWNPLYFAWRVCGHVRWWLWIKHPFMQPFI